MLSTSVQADLQGPSMTTLLLDFRTCLKKSTLDAATPPVLDSIRTSVELDRISARAAVTRLSDKAACEMKRLIGAFLAIALLPGVSSPPPKADILSVEVDVYYVPIADISDPRR